MSPLFSGLFDTTALVMSPFAPGCWLSTFDETDWELALATAVAALKTDDDEDDELSLSLIDDDDDG